MQDISDERRRHYLFPDGYSTTVEQPQSLHEYRLPTGDVHEIVCASGKQVTLYGPFRMITKIMIPITDDFIERHLQ